MQLLSGRVAQEYNQRKGRKGAFWEDRYHATAVQSDGHLTKCMTYIDLNMVRARAVEHPKDWEVCGYNEIQQPWERKGVIDFDSLLQLMQLRTHSELAEQLDLLLQEEILVTRRNSAWTESIAVGTEAYLQTLKGAYSELKITNVSENLATLRFRNAR